MDEHAEGGRSRVAIPNTFDLFGHKWGHVIEMFGKTTGGPIDGIDMLKRRERTRLWYRREPEPVDLLSPQEAVATAEEDTAEGNGTSAPAGTDRLVAETISLSADLQKVLEETAAESEQPQLQKGTDALTEWRDAPAHCPVLLLSATPLLDARNPGPILGPGTRFRILTVRDGVAALEVAALDGQIGAGYCNAIDLTCIQPDIANLRREGGGNGRHTGRLNLNRISQRISGVTGALVG